MEINKILEKGVSYEAFCLISERIAKAKDNNGVDKDSKTRLLISRNLNTMEKVLKDVTIPFSLFNGIASNTQQFHWLVIAEPWCQDTANVLPILYKLSEVNEKIELRIIFRDEQPEVMDQFLTDGKRAIPKLICFDQDHHIVGEWGPRPLVLQKFIDKIKTNSTISSDELKMRIHIWYHTDGGTAIFNELEIATTTWFKRVGVNSL